MPFSEEIALLKSSSPLSSFSESLPSGPTVIVEFAVLSNGKNESGLLEPSNEEKTRGLARDGFGDLALLLFLRFDNGDDDDLVVVAALLERKVGSFVERSVKSLESALS